MRKLWRWLWGDPQAACAAPDCEGRVAVGRFCFDHALTIAADPWRG